MHDKQPVHIFGEVLFDNFPDGNRILGGAPFNVAWHLQAFGQQPRFISRIGDDPPGQEIAARMAAWGMNRDSLQIDPERPTGSVQVEINDDEPCYEIVPDSAYDFISIASSTRETTHGILYHGSLAARHPVARKSLQTLKIHHQGKIFMDVNLREPWWERETIMQLLSEADWVKLNAAELSTLYPSETALETAMAKLFAAFNLDALVVTRGEYGAVACDSSMELIEVKPASSVAVVDTVGAGDAFAAVLLLGLCNGWPLNLSLERAQAFASALVTRRGATVDSPEFYQPFCAQWGY